METREHYGRQPQQFAALNPIESMGIAFDIETKVNPGVEDQFDPESVALGNVKDPEKIAAKVEEAKARFIDKAALSPSLSRIVSIGFYGHGFKTPMIQTARKDDDEEKLINEFFHVFTSMRDRAIVSFRGLSFDLPFLYHRARVWRNKGVFELPPATARQRSTDMFKELTFGMYWGDIGTLWPDASLAGFAKQFGVDSVKRQNECEGKDYAEYVLSEDVEKVKMAHNHLTADLEETYALYSYPMNH